VLEVAAASVSWFGEQGDVASWHRIDGVNASAAANATGAIHI
jgi:hypothetical protein